jgi:hypothetical protein
VGGLTPRRGCVTAWPGTAAVAGDERGPQAGGHVAGTARHLDGDRVGPEDDAGQITIGQQGTELGQAGGAGEPQLGHPGLRGQLRPGDGHQHMRAHTVLGGGRTGAQRGVEDGLERIRALLGGAAPLTVAIVAAKRHERAQRPLAREAVQARTQMHATVRALAERAGAAPVPACRGLLGRGRVAAGQLTPRDPAKLDRIHRPGPFQQQLFEPGAMFRGGVGQRVGDDLGMCLADPTRREPRGRVRGVPQPPARLRRVLRLRGREVELIGEETLGLAGCAGLPAPGCRRDRPGRQIARDPATYRREPTHLRLQPAQQLA